MIEIDVLTWLDDERQARGMDLIGGSMSAEAIANVRRIWEKLTLARVKRVIAREPEDVLSTTVYAPNGHIERTIASKRWRDVPEKDRSRSRVAWRHFYGFTEGDLYFHNEANCGIDCDIDLTMDFSTWGNHRDEFTKPDIGALIAGEVEQGPRGPRFKRWFVVPPGLAALMEMVREGKTELTEEELARKLVTSGYPDMYWAIARLVFFDNVQAFVDELKDVDIFNDPRPPHPAHGMVTGKMAHSDEELTVLHRGMWLPIGVAQYVHLISYHLSEPKWWEEFNRLAEEQGLRHEHPPMGGVCKACEHDKRTGPTPSAYDVYDDFSDLERLDW